MAIGTNIKKIREDKNISFDEMVKKLRIFERYYSLVEKNLQIPNDNLLKKIAKELGVSSDDIINYDEQKSSVENKKLDLKNLKYKEINIKTLPTEPIKVGEITYIPIKKPTVREIILQKPQLLNRDDLFKFGNNIKLVGVNDVLPDTITDVVNPFEGLITNLEKPSSPKILNWVEPYKYRGVLKTLFYTNVNSGLKEGDRVFILNGNYDSNKLIETNKYRRQRDGYKVLFVDNCKIVLDIDYTGVLPYKEKKVDDFINLYVIENESDFKYFNRKITTRGGNFDYKFNSSQNTIVYSDINYTTPMIGWGENTGLFGAPGFFVKNGTQSWSNITAEFITGSFSIAENLSYNSNNELIVMNGSFTYSISNEIVEFQKNKVYKWRDDLDEPNWYLNSEYDEPILTKSNFRDGNFKGEWNSGLFGQQEKKIKWEGYPAVWNLGTLLNTKWLSGEVNSIYTLPVSYISEFENNSPYQKLNAPNNNGWGYNYIIDSEFESVTIENANIKYSNIGNKSLTYSIVENHILGTQSNYSFIINKALVEDSYLVNGYIKESDILNSISLNSSHENIKSINSTYKNSIIKNSKYLSDDNIKILAYEELSLNIDNTIPTSSSHKVYKFYISEKDYKKLRINDKFYIKGLKLNDSSKYPLNFFNKKFKLSTWTEYIEYYDNNFESFYKRGIESAAFISTPKDNEWLYNTYYDNSTISTILTEQIDVSLSDYYSIDIFVSAFDINSSFIEMNINGSVPSSELSKYGLTLNYDYTPADSANPTAKNNKLRDIIDISQAFIVNADFESGIIETSDWISGNHINYNNDVNITKINNDLGEYDIIANTFSSTLLVKTTSNYNLGKFDSGDNYLQYGDIVFLNSVYYKTNLGQEIRLPDSYKIINNNFRTSGELLLEEVGTNIISTLPDITGTFSTPDAHNRYGYIHKAKIDSTKIKSGIFRRSYIINSFIENDNYDIFDKTFNNLLSLKNLVISDSIFKDTNNILSKSTYLHTSFVTGSDDYKKGIVFRSLWNGPTFSNGVFKESTWFNGKFIDGAFYNNRSFNSSPNQTYQTYDTDRIKSYYKSGITTATISNNRLSWRSGEFISGEFLKSDWESGIFNDGEFIISNFYDGTINGGIIGNMSLKSSDTKIYKAEINKTIVENATLFASDPNYNGLSSSNINWYSGTFNNGIFGSDISQGATNSAIWENGTFNGGEFASMAKWKNGTFNGGKFTSGYGWTMSKDSTTQSEYAWEYGIFNSGIFGNESTGTNSTWFDGVFNGGKFTGRIWNNGIFQYGIFEGSSTYSAIINGDNKIPSSNASLFNDSFTQSYYGLWKNGIVDNSLINNSNDLLNQNVTMRNFLWESGTFSHLSGTIENSLWLDGAFLKGNFNNSAFNPFVKRDGATESSFNLNDITCYWKNGKLYNSDFYISEWKNGTFNLGNSFGMVWKDGICEYMNAFNIFWETGIWKNGNWNGSYISYDGTLDDEFEKQLLLRGASWNSSNGIHIWNVFQEPIDEVVPFDSQSASVITSISFNNTGIAQVTDKVISTEGDSLTQG